MSFHIAFLLVLAGYVIATAFYLLRIITGHSILSAVGLRLTIVVSVFQGIVLFWHWHSLPGEAFQTYLDYFQMASLLLAWVFIALCFFRKFYALGPFVLPVLVLLVNASLTISNPYSLVMTERGSTFLFCHLVSIFLALVAFSFSLISAVAYLVLDRGLKQKLFTGWTLHLPPLKDIEGIHYKSLLAGFILLSAVILTGAGYKKILTGYYLSGDLKQVLSYVSWFFLAILLNLRVKQGWRGHRGIVISAAGLSVIGILFVVGFR